MCRPFDTNKPRDSLISLREITLSDIRVLISFDRVIRPLSHANHAYSHAVVDHILWCLHEID